MHLFNFNRAFINLLDDSSSDSDEFDGSLQEAITASLMEQSR